MIVGGFGAAAGVVVVLHGLPEEGAKNFNALSNLTMVSDYRVMKNATGSDNTFAYAINRVAARAVDIATHDMGVEKILADSSGRAVTIAGVQPTVFQDSAGKLQYDSAGGQVIITSNWQEIGGQPYTTPLGFSEISGKSIVSHQQVWNVVVDVDGGKVVSINPDPERMVTDTIEPDTITLGTNMFLPSTVKVAPGEEVAWVSKSPLQHNVFGTFQSDSGNQTRIDSGFFGPQGVFKHKFDSPGIFTYECTIHSQDGMKGTIIVGNG